MQSDEKEDILNSISSLNLNADDFEFNEIDLTNPKEATVCPISGEIEIKYISSNKSRKYKTGHGSSWPAEFEFDLKTNYFVTR